MTAPHRTAPQTFMVVGTFHADTDPAALQALLPAEEKQVEVLRAAGKLGAVHLSLARSTAFVEIIAADEEDVAATVATLPLSRFVDIDIYPTPAAGPRTRPEVVS
jgi:muconolactone delta-isomerase